ncbi:hypothetical protein [Flexivirga alba]|uniref:PH domain-containing protein n=1 Tax=Flexivirga alba TaxID=702742 RepID=A0ABW2AIY0_9MICO
MAVLNCDRIVDDGDSLLGRRSRTWPTVYAVVSGFELLYGILLLAQASARGGLYVLPGVCFALLAVTWSVPAVVDVQGVRAIGRLRRVPWANIAAIHSPDSHESSVVVVLASGKRVQTGFPVAMLSRMAALRDNAQHRLTAS